MGAERTGPPLTLEVAPVPAVFPLLPGADLHVTVPHPGKRGRITARNHDGTRVVCTVTQDAVGALVVTPVA